MTVLEIIQLLFHYGHFRNPANRANGVSWNVHPEDLAHLDVSHPAVQEALLSYQTFFADTLDPLTQQIHGRGVFLDGIIGPATEKLMEMPRCGVPEFANKEEANWPTTCRNEITVSYEFDSINAILAAAAWPQALKAWVDRCELMFDLLPAFSNSSRIWATDGPLSGSTLAWSYLAQNDCGARLEQRYNTSVNWGLSLLSSTIIHEVGHALGLDHINDRNAIMYPSITDVTEPQEPDIAAMERLGYKRRTTPLPPDDPGPLVWTHQCFMDENTGDTLKIELRPPLPR